MEQNLAYFNMMRVDPFARTKLACCAHSYSLPQACSDLHSPTAAHRRCFRARRQLFRSRARRIQRGEN